MNEFQLNAGNKIRCISVPVVGTSIQVNTAIGPKPHISSTQNLIIQTYDACFNKLNDIKLSPYDDGPY
jgi:hypothetical protein